MYRSYRCYINENTFRKEATVSEIQNVQQLSVAQRDDCLHLGYILTEGAQSRN